MNKPFLPLLLLCCGSGVADPSSAAAGKIETFGPMTVTVPSEWRRRTEPDGTIAFAIGAVGNKKEECEVFISSGDNPSLTESAAHQGIWAQMLSQLETPERQESGASGRFNWSEAEAFNRKEKRREWYRLYTTKEGTTVIGIIVGANAARLFRTGVDSVEELLANAKFAGTSDAGSLTSTAGSAGSARDAADVPIVESHVHIQIQPTSFTSSILTDHILLFENGIAVRTGVIDGPRECYAALPVSNLTTLPFNYGRWREEKATRAIDVDWQEGPAWHLTREKEEKLSLNGKRLLKLRPVDGARFDGAYVYRSTGSELTALGFTADGRFEALNLTESMTCNGTAIANGSGTYEVRKWTLILHFSNGKTSMLPLTIRDEENLQNVRKFSVKHFEFVPAS